MSFSSLLRNICNKILGRHGGPQGHHNIHIGFVSVSRSPQIKMLQADTKGHTNYVAMLKVWILESFLFQKAYHYAPYTPVLSVCVLLLYLFNQLTECYHTGTPYI
jgi:hypothetical protein